MFRYSVRTSRIQIDVNAIDIEEALMAVLRIHRPDIPIRQPERQDLMPILNCYVDCDIYRDGLLVLMLGPNKEKRSLKMNEPSLDLKQLRRELETMCSSGRQGLVEIKQIDMLIHLESAAIAAYDNDENQMKHHLLNIRKECWPWIVEQKCPAVVELMKQLHLDRINVDRESGNSPLE